MQKSVLSVWNLSPVKAFCLDVVSKKELPQNAAILDMAFNLVMTEWINVHQILRKNI